MKTAISLFILTVTARFLILALIPAQHYSYDLNSWLEVARVISDGGNPYTETTFLNWGPVWPTIIKTLDLLGGYLSLELVFLIRLFLILIDGAIVVQVWRLSKQVLSSAQYKDILWLYILHPLPIILCTIHLNFDAVFILLLLAAIELLLKYFTNQESIYWLIACLITGLAIATKTPAALFSFLLITGFQHRKTLTNILGLTLILTPCCLAYYFLYLSAPGAVLNNILLYNSVPGFHFGLSQLSSYFKLELLHSLLFVAILLYLSYRFFQKYAAEAALEAAQLCKFLILPALLVLTLGSGFGPQYFLWLWAFLPLASLFIRNEQRSAMQSLTISAAIIFPILYLIHPNLSYLMVEKFNNYTLFLSAVLFNTLYILTVYFTFKLLNNQLDYKP